MPAPEPGMDLDLTTPRTLHVVGAGGAGMSALAAVLTEMGHTVSASDIKDGRRLERLRVLGTTVHVPQAASNVPADADAVIVSTAIPDHNVEVRAARNAGIPVVHRGEALGALTATRRAIGVAGTHGKTTTSSMITLILRFAGLAPSFVIGSELNEVGTNGAFDVGEHLVVEADESDGSFLRLDLDVAVVTNVDHDHLWFWGTYERMTDAFARYVDGARSLRVLCIDDSTTARLARVHPDAVTYGYAEGATYRGVGYEPSGAGSRVAVIVRGVEVGVLELPVRGAHHAQNALAATAVTMELGVPFEIARRALANFGGVARRFQARGEIGGATIVDDYALLPPEIAATIRAAREGPWARIVAVFQPFRYVRTAAMWSEFADAFVDADRVVLTDVCGAGDEEPVPGVTGHLLVQAVLDAHPDFPVVYLPRRADLVAHVPASVRPGDLILTLGGGDITTLADDLLAARRVRA